MSELKTLKDIIEFDELDVAQAIRAEAVKWVKWELPKDQKDKLVRMSINLWIEEFFNLTEEDLKDDVKGGENNGNHS